MTPHCPSTLPEPQGRFYAFGPFVLDGLRGMLWQRGTPVPLTPKVIQLLAALVSRPGAILSKDELIREIWGGTDVEENNLAQYVSRIREALGERPGQREYIATTPGIGYGFVASVTKLDELPELVIDAPFPTTGTMGSTGTTGTRNEPTRVIL